MSRTNFLRFLPVLFFTGLLFAQEPLDWNQRLQQLRRAEAVESFSDYRLGPGDLLEIRVYGVEGFEHTLRVNSKGRVRIPLIGDIAVSGATTGEIEEDLTSQLGRNLIREPQVSVFIKEYRSQPVLVLGAVQQPGKYQITQSLRLVDTLAMAGGLDLERADRRALVQRSQDGSRASEAADAIEVNLEDLLEKGELSLNLEIYGGDIVNVPERQRRLFYVIGEVHRPGAFEIPFNKEISLTQGLAWAGGPMKTAKIGKGLLVRYEGDDRKEIPLDFKNILKGSAPDIAVQTRDVLFIPGSTFKDIGYGLLNIIPATISGAIVFGPLNR